MALVGPWLNDIGSSKKKVKYASAAAKKRDLELQADWIALKLKIDSTAKRVDSRPMTRPMPKLGPPPGRETPFIRSLDTGKGNTAKIASPVYTGTKIIGIGTMHKSNAVPIFSEEDAKAISSMRR
jgi:hypothetical protein